MMQTHFMYSLLGTYERFEKTAMTQAVLLEDQTKTDFEEMSRLEKEKLSRIKEFSQQQITAQNWSIFSTIANNITPLIPVISGASLVGDKETKTAGYLMIGSGVASIANRLFQATGVYDKISTWMTPSKSMQETIASRLETGMQYASWVAGAAGGYLAATSSLVADQVASWMTISATAVKHGIDLGQSFTELGAKHIQADVQIAESQIQQRFQNIHQIAKESERLTHTISEICEMFKSAVQSLYSR